MTTSTTTASTRFFDMAGNEIWPCRCGETHTGLYAIYDYGHHNCFHTAPLLRLLPEELPDYLMCPLCGVTFEIDAS